MPFSHIYEIQHYRELLQLLMARRARCSRIADLVSKLATCGASLLNALVVIYLPPPPSFDKLRMSGLRPARPDPATSSARLEASIPPPFPLFPRETVPRRDASAGEPLTGSRIARIRLSKAVNAIVVVRALCVSDPGQDLPEPRFRPTGPRGQERSLCQFGPPSQNLPPALPAAR